MQLMAVRAGGVLDQHTPDVVGHDEHSPEADAYGWISISTSELARARAGRQPCRSAATTTNRSPATLAFRDRPRPDGTVEAIEDQERPFWLVCSGTRRMAMITGCSAAWSTRRPTQRQLTGRRPPVGNERPRSLLLRYAVCNRRIVREANVHVSFDRDSRQATARLNVN